MKTIKGPAIFLAQFAGDTAPFNSLDAIAKWAAGLGLRYYSAVGPIRFDVAFPLNPRSIDDPYQFYISIGQAF